MAIRPSKQMTFVRLAENIAEQSTCRRRHVGCFLVDVNHHVLAVGYNGVAKGMKHCLDVPCAGSECKSGEGLDLCLAIHAEQNALIRCKDPNIIHTCYTNVAPCMHCLKMLLNTSCYRIVFLHNYADSERCKELWESAGRQWEQL
jgi:dCMP deaminase